MSIKPNREDDIIQLAEERATDDADSLYPLAEEDETVLLRKGQQLTREFGLEDEEATLFAEHYASLYQAEVDCLDRDYEPENEEVGGFIMARRIRLADRDAHSLYQLQTTTTTVSCTTYRQAKRAYNHHRRMHKSARLSLVRYLDVTHERLLDAERLLACGSFLAEDNS